MSYSLYSAVYSPVHRISIVDNREFWVWVFAHFDLSDALELLDDMLDDDQVQIETVADIIPSGYFWTIDHGFVFGGRDES